MNISGVAKFESDEGIPAYQEEVMKLLPDETKQYDRRYRRVTSQVEDMVASGNEKQLMDVHSQHLLQGIDVQDVEARNQSSASAITPEVYAGRSVLWIVGISHLAGLTIELGKLGWKASPFTPPA